MSANAKKAVAELFEAKAAEALAERPPPVVKARGGKARLLKIVDADGKPTGKIATHGQVLQGVAKKAELELAAQDGKRPTHIVCICGSAVRVSEKGGPIPTQCKRCARRRKKKRTREDNTKYVKRYREKNREKLKGKDKSASRQKRYRAKKKAEKEAKGVVQG